MDDAFYLETAQDAADVIEQFGQPCVLTREGSGGGKYDPDTQDVTNVPDAEFTSNTAKLDYETRDIDGANILVGDVRFLIGFDLGTEPTNGDVITLTRSGSQWSVVRSKTLDPGGVAVLYDVQARAM